MAASFQVVPPESFNFACPEQWTKWIRRFERFRIASGLSAKDDEAQVNTLIYAMGDEADDILRSFNLSEDESKRYDAVKGKFESHFDKRRNVIYERARFNMRRQEENEAIDTFVTALYALAEHCGYGSLHDEMIRDRIVVGIRNTSLSERLQLDPKLTLESAVTQVRQSETVKQQQAVLRGSSTLAQEIPVGAVQRGRGNWKGKPFKGVNPGVNNGSQSSATSRDNPKGCSRCGKLAFHDKANCPAKDAICRRCNKRGHFQAVCRSAAKVAGVQSSARQDTSCILTMPSSEDWNIQTETTPGKLR